MDDQDAAVTAAIHHSIKAPVEQLEKEALLPTATTANPKTQAASNGEAGDIEMAAIVAENGHETAMRGGGGASPSSPATSTARSPRPPIQVDASQKEELKVTIVVRGKAGNSNSGLPSPLLSSSTPSPTTKQVTIIDPAEAKKQLGECSEEDPAMARVILKVYPRRWLIMLIVALLNNSNAMSWISFSPVANHVDVFYATESAANYFSVIYLAITIPVGFLAMWGERRFGLRWAIIIAALTNGVGGLIRLSSSFLSPQHRFTVGILGQGIAGVAYPFIMFLPSKVAAVWFPERQRAIATTIGLMANPMGIFLANIVSPNMVASAEDVPYINVITAVPAALIAILAVVFVRRSKPKMPPSLSASAKSYDFVEGLKSCVTSLEFLLLLLIMGGGMGMFNCLYTLMQQLLCPSGYANTFAGTCAALMITGGVLGAFLSGTFVDRTKKYDEALKVSMAVAVLCGLVFLQLALRRELGALISMVAFLFGVFGMAAYPVGLELAAECTFPVTPTTSSGLIVIVGQIQSVIYIKLMQYFAEPLHADYMQYQVCTAPELVATSDQAAAAAASAPNDWTRAILVMSIVAATLVAVLFAFFRPKYRRTEAERGGGAGGSQLQAAKYSKKRGGGAGKEADGALLTAVDESATDSKGSAMPELEMDLREAKPAEIELEEAAPKGN